MKIFNWVHCKFHNKDGWTNGNAKKKAESDVVVDQHVALADAIASWRQGILTIGTFGFDPLKHFNQLKEIESIPNEQEETEDDKQNYDKSGQFSFDEKCKEDQNPLVHNAAKHGFNSTINAHDQEPEVTITSADLVADDNFNNHNLGNDKKEIKGERVTLADLFSADCEEYISPKPHTLDDNAKVFIIQTEDHKDHVIKKAKEAAKSPTAKRLKEDSLSRPIKKINRMMTKILKRKIHPEADKRNTTKHSCESGANELASLL